MSMLQGGKSLRDGMMMNGCVDINVYHGKGEDKHLVDHQVLKNIIFYQGQGRIIETLATISPSTLPAIVNRMCVGDQGTIPASPSTPKIPTKDLPQLLPSSGLYHEVFRKDIDSRVVVTSSGGTISLVGVLTSGLTVVTAPSTSSLASGMTITGPGIPLGSVIASVNSSTQFTIGPNPATLSGSQTLSVTGAANQAQFISEFDASSIALSAYSNPSNPVINEVGLVLINPAAPAGLNRLPVTAPTMPPSDEVVMSIRCFPSIPFTLANSVSITIRYTIYME